jgi:hypothetical protein
MPGEVRRKIQATFLKNVALSVSSHRILSFLLEVRTRKSSYRRRIRSSRRKTKNFSTSLG